MNILAQGENIIPASYLICNILLFFVLESEQKFVHFFNRGGRLRERGKAGNCSACISLRRVMKVLMETSSARFLLPSEGFADQSATHPGEI
jgi:hypothetical protein